MNYTASTLACLLVCFLLNVYSCFSQQRIQQDSLRIPGTKKVGGGGRGDGTGGGRGDISRKKSLPEALIVSPSKDVGLKSNNLFSNDTTRANQLGEIAKSFADIEIDSAILFAKKSLSLSQQVGYKKGMINARYLLNSFYVRERLPDDGIANGIALLELVSSQPKFNESMVYASMAMFNQALGKVEEARKYWSLTMQSYKEKKDTVNLIVSYIDASIFYNEIGDFQESLNTLEKGLRVSELAGNYVAEHYILGLTGKVYANKGDFGKSVQYLNQSLRLKKLYYRPVSLAYGYYHLQQVYLAEGLYEKSIDFGKEVRAVLEINPGTYLYKNSIIATREASEALGRQAPSIHSSEKMESNTHERLMQVRQLRALHNNEKTDEYIYFQRNAIGALEEKTYFQQKLIGMISLGLFLVFGAIYLLRSRSFAVKERIIQEHFSQQLLTYQEDERKKTARDLHDSIGQSLILIKNRVQLKDKDTGKMIANTLEEVRAISKQLHPVLLEKLGLTTSIEKLVEEVDKMTEVFVESEIQNVDHFLSKEQEVHLYRIIQETINNMLKHAAAVSVNIQVKVEQKNLRYLIEDRGKGFDLTEDSAQFQSLGMQTLKERTKILNGKLLIESTVGKGTTIELIIPKPTEG